MRSRETLASAIWAPTLLAVILPCCALAAPPSSANPTAPAEAAANAASDPGAAARPPVMRVSYRDLDLATPEGIAALYVRIRRAAATVCEPNRTLTGTRLVTEAFERCVRTAVASTVKQIGVPGLATLDATQQVLGETAIWSRSMCDRPGRAKIII